jgi:CheY-like chemotaxis protein
LTGIKVVLVEDHLDSRRALSMLLKLYGAQVTAAADGQEGLAAIRLVQPDVVVTDLDMPGLDGYGLIRAVRALGPEAGGTVPFILFSSHTRPEERAKTREAGFALHLGKPAMPEELVQAILKAVTGRPKGSAPP